jgi:hypothetical protein
MRIKEYHFTYFSEGGVDMDRGKLGAVTIGITVMILLLVFLFVLYASFHPNRPQITLPEEGGTSDSLTVDGDESDGSGVAKVEVTTETVQNVIATLSRPEAYTRIVTVTTYWSGGSGTTTVKAAVSGSRSRLDATLPSGQVRHTIRTEEETYVWYGSDRTVYTAQNGDISADDEQLIPTYEDLLQIPAEQIVEAGYETHLEQDCIYAATAANEQGYSERYWVAVDSGLLIAAEREQNGEVVYRMESSDLSLGAPDDSAFVVS